MLIKSGLMLSVILFSSALWSSAGKIYVSTAGSPANDGSSWSKAISDIGIAGQKALAGDTIEVTNGVYSSGGEYGADNNNVLKIKAWVKVRSVNGRKYTTITGGGTNRCVYMGRSSSIEGFTLTDGIGGSGGGVYAEGYCHVTNCCVKNCQTTNSVGGGIFMSAGYVDNSVIESNTAYYSGGGIAINCIVSGGGHVRNSIIRDNRANLQGDSGGGGIIGEYTLVENCLIENNISENLNSWGGGVYLNWDAVIRNSLVINNTSKGDGGGVCLTYGARMENCTVINNHTTGTCGGILTV